MVDSTRAASHQNGKYPTPAESMGKIETRHRWS